MSRLRNTIGFRIKFGLKYLRIQKLRLNLRYVRQVSFPCSPFSRLSEVAPPALLDGKLPKEWIAATLTPGRLLPSPPTFHSMLYKAAGRVRRAKQISFKRGSWEKKEDKYHPAKESLSYSKRRQRYLTLSRKSKWMVKMSWGGRGEILVQLLKKCPR